MVQLPRPRLSMEESSDGTELKGTSVYAIASTVFGILTATTICHGQEQPQRMPVRSDQSEHWQAALTVLQQELDAPIAVYIGDRTLEAPSLENLRLSPDHKLIAVASRLRGVYLWTPHFHVIGPNIKSRSENHTNALLLLEFVETLNGDQLAQLFTTGISINSLSGEQLARSAPLFFSETHLESLVNGETESFICVRPSPIIEPAEPRTIDPRNVPRRNLADSIEQRRVAATKAFERSSTEPTVPRSGVSLQPVTPSNGSLRIHSEVLSLAEFADRLESELELSFEFDRRIANHIVFVHGNFDQETAVNIFSHLAHAALPQVVSRHDLNARIQALVEKAMEHWDEIAETSIVDLTKDELAMFLERATMPANALDRGSGRFEEFFRLAGISQGDNVRLDVTLHWQISSLGEFVPRDASGNALTIDSGSGRTARTFGVTVANGKTVLIER